MKKIMTLTQEQMELLNKSEDKERVVKTVLNLSDEIDWNLGDTAVQINNASPLDVFKNIYNNKEYYYIVIKRLSDNLVYAYSIYSF